MIGPMSEAGGGRWKEKHPHPWPSQGFLLSLGIELNRIRTTEGEVPEDKLPLERY